MPLNRNSPFKIASMDSLGQGVSKEEKQVLFVRKSLPGEEGVAEIHTERKGVAFGKVKELTKRSELRIDPICPHFAECPSCHYLHTDYQSELAFKKESLENMFYKRERPEITVVPAVRRLGYRNRIQLHYDTKIKKLGMLDAGVGKIVPVPDCLIALAPIKTALQNLYAEDQWLREVPREKSQGHVELYVQGGVVQKNWNRPYADGGFTQVFQEMNQLLKEKIKNWYESRSPSDLLDLFAGNGNMSVELNYSRRLCVDLYAKVPGESFFHQELYTKNALENIVKELANRELKPRDLILDPPRSGLKELGDWLRTLKPERVAYVSCDPHTMIRDLDGISDFRLVELELYDFFPSTFHFETVAFLERKS